MTAGTPSMFGPDYARQKWAWVHLSLLSRTDLDQALQTVRGMSSQERDDLLRAALTTQATLLSRKPQAVVWHEQLQMMWTCQIVGEVMPRDTPW